MNNNDNVVKAQQLRQLQQLQQHSQPNQEQEHKQQITRQGAPLSIIPGLTGNILATVSFLIGTSSFILGLRIQNAARITPSLSTLPSSTINKYFDLLILALVIPSIVINIYGILTIGNHLYPEDTPYLILLFVLFMPIGVILFLIKKLH
ncbi:MAG TPA: hypothetical protein VIY08_03115 [Candidatus Nitrosocosmicus sp.]